MALLEDYVRFSVVAAVLGAACSPSIEPISVDRQCPNMPFRRPQEYAKAADPDLLITDFEGDDHTQLAKVGHRDGSWILGNETNPTPTLLIAKPLDDCAALGQWSGHFQLSAPTSWGANWTAVFRVYPTGTAVPYDARAYGGISFWAAFGGNNRVSEHVAFGVTTLDTAWNNGICSTSCTSVSTWVSQCSSCNVPYLYNVSLTRDWQHYVVRFDQMAQAPPAATPLRRDQLVGFIMWPRQEVDLWIDEIRFEP
jgi:hypothetical protein